MATSEAEKRFELNLRNTFFSVLRTAAYCGIPAWSPCPPAVRGGWVPPGPHCFLVEELQRPSLRALLITGPFQ